MADTEGVDRETCKCHCRSPLHKGVETELYDEISSTQKIIIIIIFFIYYYYLGGGGGGRGVMAVGTQKMGRVV